MTADQTTMRSDAEILERIDSITDDFFGFEREVLIEHLSFDAAKPFLVDDATDAVWFDGSRETLLAQTVDYLEFAVGKALDHRGISASRSVSKMTSYLWLLGGGPILDAFESAPYAPYGAPQLAAAVAALEVSVPDIDEWRRMAAGLPCYEGCEGCSS